MNQFILVSYANGNYSKDLYMKCLIYRLVYKISDAPIEWFSKRQSIVDLSTIEAKYWVFSKAAKKYYIPTIDVKRTTNL